MSLMTPRFPGLGLRALAAIPLAASLALTAGCDIALSGAREEATETLTRSYPISAGGTLDLATVNGRIDVVSGTKPTVELKAVKIARSATKEGAADLLKKYELKEEVGASLVKVRLEKPASGGPTLNSWGQSVEVRYEVQVPPGVKLVLESTNGNIDVADVKSPATLETVNGRISARGLTGAVKASTVNGGIDVALAAVTEDVSVETTNGGVTVRLPADAKASLVGRTTNGGVNVNGLQVEELERSRRRLEARLNGGGSRIEAETTNGGITFARAGGTE
jgi:DUF4097 and DUF4098 domain-containing protein YvlB